MDFGSELVVHELVAVAFDGEGRELGRVRQWVNRPRALAEAAFVVEPPVKGQPLLARLEWQSVVDVDPISVKVLVDGRPIDPPSATSISCRPSWISEEVCGPSPRRSSER